MDLDIATQLCERFEGFRSKPYLCPAGIPTIGIGSTFYENGTKVTLQDAPISLERARELLAHELSKVAAPAVLRSCPVLANYPERFNAIVDFTFNLGSGRLQSSTLRRKINAQDWDGAVAQLKLWVRGGGRVLPGLVLRRNAEALLLQ